MSTATDRSPPASSLSFFVGRCSDILVSFVRFIFHHTSKLGRLAGQGIMSLEQCYSRVRHCLIVVEKEPFRFLDLPLEIRLMVYEFTFDFDSLDKYIKGYFEQKRSEGSRGAPPYMTMTCPSILLVSKEVCNEAKPILHATPLSLSYGALDLKIPSLISPDLLRNLQHITISDVGCREVDPPPDTVFTGYCYAVLQIASHFRQGHRLKTFEVSFKSPYVMKHLHQCLPDPSKHCGIKSWAHNLRRYMKEMQGLKRVVVDVGLAEDIKKDIVDKMLAKPTGLMALPYHVRGKIWSYAADFNDAVDVMRRVHKELAQSIISDDPVKTTPTVLLLNKQINSEALQLMYERPLIISGLAKQRNGPIDLEHFISQPVLRRIKAISINVTDHRQLAMLDQIKDAVENSHRLQKLHLHLWEPDSRHRLLTAGNNYPDPALVQILTPLITLRRINKVKITGTLPECFVRPLMYNMSKIRPGDPGRVLQAESARGDTVEIPRPRLVLLDVDF